MTHPQNSHRGLLAKESLIVDNLTVNTATTITGDVGVTGAVTASGAITSGGFTLTGNSTCIKLETRSALPTTRQPGGICFVFNSTVRALAFHSTGTTWVYVDSTT